MARKSTTVTIDRDGRDKGKVFYITEFSSRRVEAWEQRAVLAVARSGVDIPPNVLEYGLASVAIIAFKALQGVNDLEARMVLDELLECVEIIPDPSRPAVKRALIEDDIEEVSTLLKLRLEVFQLITGFTVPAALLSALRGFIQEVGNSLNTLTSDPKSAQ